MWKPGQIVTVAGKICRIKRRLPVTKGGHLGCLSGCAFAKSPRWTGVCRRICREQWYDNLHSKLPVNCYFEEIRGKAESPTKVNNNVIIEDYVSFNIAKLLKQKGFNCGCISYYEHFSSNVTLYSGMVTEWSDSYTDHNKTDDRYSRPTIQMTMKWLRINFHLDFDVCCEYKQSAKVYYYSIFKKTILRNMDCIHSETGFKSNEKACEALIEYCLNNIDKIKIIL